MTVGPLALPPPGTPWPAARSYAAVELFLDRARAVRPDLRMDDSSTAAVMDVCRRLDGLPLALELAAARLRSMPVEQLAARLSDRFRLLNTGGRTAQPRHRTLHAAVAWSWDLLDDAEREVLRRLAVSPSGLTLDAAEQICAGCGATELDPLDVLDLLSALVDKSLVLAVPAGRGGTGGSGGRPVRDAGPGGYRYRMLETIRAFAAAELDRSAEAEAEAVHRRHAGWFTELAQAARPHLNRADQLPWIRRLTDEHENLLAAVRWAVAHRRTDLAFHLGATLGWLWTVQGHHGLVLHWLGAILDMPRPARAGPGPVDLIRAEAGMHVARVVNLGILRSDAERDELLRAAEPVVEQALATCRAAEADDDVGIILVFGVFRALWDADRAEVFRRTAQLLHSPNLWIRAGARLIRALAAQFEADLDTAREELVAAIDLHRVTGDRWGLHMALSRSAELASLLGAHESAMAAFGEAVDLATEIEAWDDAAILRLRIAQELHRVGREEDARAEVDRARELSSLHGPGAAVLVLDLTLGEFARKAGDHPDASVRYRRMLAALDGFGPVEFAGLGYNGLALVAAADGDRAAAAAWHRRAVDLMGRLSGVDQRTTAVCAALEAVALTGRRFGLHDGAARLLGAAEGLRGSLDRGDPEIIELEAGLRADLGARAFADAVAAGTRAVRGARADELRARLSAMALATIDRLADAPG